MSSKFGGYQLRHGARVLSLDISLSKKIAVWISIWQVRLRNLKTGTPPPADMSVLLLPTLFQASTEDPLF